MQTKIRNSGFTDWKPAMLPDLMGRTYLITGGNSGIGLEAAKMLAHAGGDVILACRNPGKAAKAVEDVKAIAKGKVDTVSLNLADLSSVRQAAETVKSRYQKLDALIDNAGIMQTPPQKTADGFEMQLGTNHLGHFLLAGLLFDLVEAAQGRIVTVSSVAHKYGRINFDDLMMTTGYTPTKAYTQSKLANLLFALELDRRLKAAGSAVSSIACHPGYSNTHLQSTGPAGVLNSLYKLLNPMLAQPAALGAIPTVLAAAGKEALPGGYYGPTGIFDMRGPVGDATVAGRALKEEDARRLWEESEKLTGFNWSSI